jgi:hypothetical protein
MQEMDGVSLLGLPIPMTQEELSDATGMRQLVGATRVTEWDDRETSLEVLLV